MKNEKTYRVYYSDGNQKLFGAECMMSLMAYLMDCAFNSADMITKIEEVKA